MAKKSPDKSKTITAKNENRKLEELLENIVHGQQLGKTGSWTHNIRTNDIFFTQQIYRILGCSSEQFNGDLESFYSFVHPDDLPAVKQATQGALHGQEYDIEYRILANDGSMKYVHEKTKTLFDENKNPVKVVGILQDITEQTILKNVLKEIEESLNEAQRLTGVGSAKYNVLENEFFGTNEFFRIFNISASTIHSNIGNQIIHSVFPEDREMVAAAINKLFHGLPCHLKFRILQENGELRYVAGKGIPVFNKEQKVINILGTIQDITENEILEQRLKKVNRVLTQAQTLTRVGSWEMDLVSGIMHWSDEASKIFGILPGEYNVTYDALLEFVHPDDVQIIENILKNRDEYLENLECRIIRPDGAVRNIRILAEFVFGENGKPYYIYGTVQDITEKKQMEEELDHQQLEIDKMSKRFHALIRESMDVFEILDADGTITYISEASERVIGYKPEERIGRKVYEFYSGTELAKAKRMMKSILDKPEEKVQETVLFRMKDGNQIYMEVIMQNLMNEPSIQGIVVNFRDISQRIQMERKMLYLSTHDEVTGLPNRLYFNQELGSYIQSAKDQDTSFAVVMIEIDGFKHISDVLGYQLGDELIIQISERLRPIFGVESLICRYSVSRLVVIIPHFYDETELSGRIQKVIDLSNHTFKVDSYGLDIGMHIGINISQGTKQEPDTIVQQAEMALFLAKNRGNNQYRYYSTGIDIRNYKQFELRNDLLLSIEQNQLQVHLQPIINLQTNEIIAAETLIRWEHPYWGMVPPDEFIPLAEETGFIINIGRWVLRQVCCLYTEWLRKGMPAIKVSINFSSIQFFEDRFVENIIKTIYEFGLDPSFLIMEITESTLLDNKEKAVLDIKRLKSYGIQIALDDFGTGFSSLAYLHSFDIDMLKIDGYFIRNSIMDTASEVIIRSIINMARELKLHLVAEGIENYQQLTYLQKQSCNSGQGYLFSKPLPVDVFEGILLQKVCNPASHTEAEPQPYKERRQSARINLPDLLEADLSILEMNKRKVDIGNTKVLVKNISPGGLCFITNIRMPVDKDAILQFAAQISGIKIQVSGSAVWINSLGSGLYEYGVKFEFKDNEKLEFIGLLNQVQEGMKHGTLISTDIPASEKENYFKKRVSEVIYEGKQNI